jgi:hypothetical protein
MATLAAIRADDVNFPLFLHVLGAFMLIGALLTVTSALLLAWRADGLDRAVLTRLGFRSLLLGAIPAYLIMRVGAQWVESEENLGDADFAWLGIGYMTADIGLLLLIIATILAGLGARRVRADAGGGRGLTNIAAVIGVLLVVAYVVAVWAMATKPV